MLYIRTDMNQIIATGHIMRCLAIAQAAEKQGEGVTFLLADRQAAALLDRLGYDYWILGTQWNDMDAEIPVLKRLIQELKIEKLLIDSYQVTELYLETLTTLVYTIYIDDLNLFTYPVNLLICYANYYQKFDYGMRYKGKGTRLLLGTRYVPLRQVFCGIERREKKHGARQVLLMSGGADRFGILERILSGLIGKQGVEIQITVICGRLFESYDRLRERYQHLDRIQFYQNVCDIEGYMKRADIAVSAGGMTLYELCACGVPTITYSVADNQLDNVRQFQQDGCMEYVGDVRYDDVVEQIVERVQLLCKDEGRRHAQSENMRGMVDGMGAARIVREIRNIECESKGIEEIRADKM